MPWLLVESPCIQTGILAACLTRAGLPATQLSLHLAFAEFAAELGPDAAITPAEYEAISTRWANFGLPEWLFAVPPFLRAPSIATADFAATLRAAGMAPEFIARLTALRAHVPTFLERAAAAVLATAPDIVGFPLVYSQTVPSVALARTLARSASGLRIVFGGALCEGPAGPALLRAYPEVDFVARGEGEKVIIELVVALRDRDDAGLAAIPGLCRRAGDRVLTVPTHPSQRSAMDDVPRPDYAEYFDRLARGPLAQVVVPHLPYQSARGCWWGMKSHCSFCGINGEDMQFRTRSARLVHADLVALSAAHGIVDFTIVDNIMAPEALHGLVPELAASEHDFALFCETKANLTRDQVAVLARAGVRTIQPGIESLSTPILKSVGKGVAGWQNLRVLKWAAEFGLRVIWNLIYGFPRESPVEYERMAALVPSLLHLPPPNLAPLMLVRFSPYGEDPARHGLIHRGPLPLYAQMYGAPTDTLADLAHVFEHAHADGRDPDSYVAPLRAAIASWNAEAARNRGALVYRRGPGFLVVTDARSWRPAPVRLQLDDRESAAYLAADAGGTVAGIAANVRRLTGQPVADADVYDILQGFVAERIAIEESGRYLSLAVAVATSWGRTSTARNPVELRVSG